MKQYLRERHESERNSTLTGIVLTIVVHVCAVFLVSFTGIKYLYPPPAENTFLLDFDEEPIPIVEQKTGIDPRGEDVNPEEKIELIQRSESPVKSTKPNTTPATKPDPHGDVAVTEPPRDEEPKPDPRASFPGMGKTDNTTTAPHGASEASTTFKPGQPTGNVSTGATEGKPNAHLEGREVDKAGLKKPVYTSQESGKVVVKIWVDQYGKVQKAVPGADGTTVTDRALWTAARNAALETGFTMSASAPALQEGTITYIFNLK
jgi:outer membrane biosynthesis protein TonB